MSLELPEQTWPQINKGLYLALSARTWCFFSINDKDVSLPYVQLDLHSFSLEQLWRIMVAGKEGNRISHCLQFVMLRLKFIFLGFSLWYQFALVILLAYSITKKLCKLIILSTGALIGCVQTILQLLGVINFNEHIVYDIHV